jgi:hypothetical protein
MDTTTYYDKRNTKINKKETLDIDVDEDDDVDSCASSEEIATPETIKKLTLNKIKETLLIILFSPVILTLGLAAWLAAYPISKYSKIPFIFTCNTLLLFQYTILGHIIFDLSIISLLGIATIQSITGYGIALAFTKREHWITGYNGEYAVISGVITSLAVLMTKLIEKKGFFTFQ